MESNANKFFSMITLTQPVELVDSALNPSESRKLTISGTVSDQSSLKTLAFSWVNDGGGSKYLSVSEEDLVNGTFAKSVDFDNSQGSWNIQYVVAEDTVGNIARSYEMTSEEFLAATGIDTTGWLNFVIADHVDADNSPPIVTLTQPTELSNGILDPSESRKPTISGTVSDQSSLKTLAFSWINDGGGSKYLSVSEKDLVNGTFTKSVDFDNSQGSWNIQWVVVEDTAGNAAKSYEMSSEEFLATTGIDTTGWLNFTITEHNASDLIIRGNSFYTIVNGPSWTQAEANSVRLGGHLTALSNKAEDDFVFNIFIKRSSTPTDYSDYLWIGLTDSAQEGTYKWSSGKDFIYNNINPINYTETHAESRQDWVLYWGQNGTWDTQEQEGYPQTGRRGIAEIPFIRRGDSAYMIVQGPTWEEAEANANALGGHLVTINDAEENKFIETLHDAIAEVSPERQVAWIGFNETEAGWEWSSGENVDYINWMPGEPSSPNENFAEYTFDVDYWGADAFKWNDRLSTGVNQYGIAEINLAPNNTPTGIPTLFGDFKAGQVITIDKTPPFRMQITSKVGHRPTSTHGKLPTILVLLK